MDYERINKCTFSEVDPDDIDSVADYYNFEIEQEFSNVPEGSTLENMIKFRQQQLRDGKMRIVVVKENGKMIGTTVIVLENGTMGKKLKDDEAWAAGTVVHEDYRNLGLGEMLESEQERMARIGEKKAMLTTIKNDNFSSMRVYLKAGYRLEAPDPREDEMDYIYRKDLTGDEKSISDWKDQVIKEQLKLYNRDEPENGVANQILVDPSNSELIKKLLADNYKGVYLLQPKDFEEPKPINKELLVFKKQL